MLRYVAYCVLRIASQGMLRNIADGFLPTAFMELRHLLYFATVARRLNFSRAADELHVAQPAVSQQIRQACGPIRRDVCRAGVHRGGPARVRGRT